jgi:NAD(P)-dependent dehydrogenase (short-subunit alcohol dehydrogenase family)
MDSTKKVALVTGATRGLGLEAARQLGRLGHAVFVGGRARGPAEAVAAGLRGEGLDARAVELDVTDEAHVARLHDAVAAAAGRLDMLVNNAGVFPEREWFANRTSRVSMRVLRETFETNLFGLVAVTQALLPLLVRSDAGRIVNLSSVMGSLSTHADPASVLAQSKPFAYSASKAALNAFTLHLADELKGTRVKVNSAHPGWVHTDLGGPAAPMGVEEGVRTVVRLATLDEGGPTGGFFHGEDALPW